MNIRRKISPNHYESILTKSDDSIEKRIEIYESRLEGWTIGAAKHLMCYEPGGYAFCYLLASYFESYTVYYRGEDSENKGKDFFRQGFFSVFTDLEEKTTSEKKEIINIMWKSFRCGLYHTGFPNEKIALVTSEIPITIIYDSSRKINEIRIDTSRFILAIEEHIKTYVGKLRDKKEIELRENFYKAYKLLLGFKYQVQP